MATVCVQTRAESYKWLTFTLTDNSQLAVAAENLEITYKDGALVLTSDKVDRTLPAATVKSLQFTDPKSAADEIEAPTDATAELYTLAGVKVGTYKSRDDARAALPSGIYIMKQNSQTTKLIF